MEIVKKNLLSVICGVVALIAVIAIFWPLGGMRDEMDQTLTSRKEVYERAQRLLRQPRSMPIVVPNSKEHERLTTFPNQSIIAAGDKAQKQVKQNAEEMLNIAIQANKHDLLVDRSLPDPPQPAAIEFVQKYKQMVGWNGQGGSLITDVLRAVVPPTQEQIEAAAKEKWDDYYSKQIVDYPNQPDANKDKITAEFNEWKAGLPSRMKLAVARQCGMYYVPGALAMNARFQQAGGALPSALDIWWAQVGLWVQQDVVAALKTANAGSTNVMDAPVKRLIQLTIPEEFVEASTAGRRSNMPRRRNAPDQFQSAAVLDPSTVVPTASVTGRVSNKMYDVAHFTLQIDVEATRIPMVLAALSRNQFITILNVQLADVDAAAMQNEGYVYNGHIEERQATTSSAPASADAATNAISARPVVTLTLECEELFMRDWTGNVMPMVLKQQLGIAPESQTALAR